MPQLSTGVFAVVLSTGLIVIFGEIVPQATISRYALVVGAKTAWIVYIFRFLLFPICFPIATTLDLILGEEMPTIWSRRELEEIIRTHEDSEESSLDADEERIILGALNFSKKKAIDIMTPKSVVFMLNKTEIINEKLLKKIKKQGFSRIPVYNKDRDHIVGVLYANDLISLKQEIPIIKIPSEQNLDLLMNKFIRLKTHIAFVYDEFGVLQGVITLEDILEEIIDKEIVDETDKIIDLRKIAKDRNI